MPKVGRNAPCPCGSQRKYKHCCGASASPALQGLTPGIRMKGGIRFHPEAQGFIVIVHTWDNAAGRGDPSEWRAPEIFPTEAAAMRHYKTSIRPSLARLMAQASVQIDATFVHRKLE